MLLERDHVFEIGDFGYFHWSFVHRCIHEVARGAAPMADSGGQIG
ncbi:unnamed protein product [Acidithrix sp. C25]|nr:unnamed protein product [Acidithrix sp. C25]